jgi:hypothetical protein
LNQAAYVNAQGFEVGCCQLEEVMRVSTLRMSRAQLAVGCLVVLVSLAGGAASAHWVNRSMSTQAMSVAMRWESSVSALQEASQAVTLAVNDSAAPRHTCITLDGKSFEWDFANAPFAVLSCSQ